MTAVTREDIKGGWRPTALSVGLAGAATTLTVTSGGLTTWTPVTHGRIPVVINRGQADEEHLYATAVAGDTLTGLTRGQDDTADQAHAAGATVEHGLFAAHIDRANEFLSSPTAAGQVPVSTGADNWGAPTTTLAGLTLTGATLTTAVLAAPTIADFTNMGHDHLDADDGGLLTQDATHEDPDTDTATSSLHHTLGTDPFQAAPGNHAHAVVWSDYTPALTGAGGNPNLGATGFATGRYAVNGDVVHVMVRIVWGGAGVTAGSGTYAVSLPTAARAVDTTTPLCAGSGMVVDASGTWYPVAVIIAGGSLTVNLFTESGALSSTTPFVPGAAGDTIHLNLTYESA